MTKRNRVVASTRHPHARFLKYYPKRHCAPSLIKSRFFRILQIYLQYLLSYILKFLICIHAGNPRMPPRVLAPGPKPCGGNYRKYKFNKVMYKRRCEEDNKTTFGDKKSHQAASDLDMKFEIFVFLRNIL